MIKRKLTLEQRIARLEMIARSNRRRTMKNEGINMSFRSEVERAVANELGDYYHVNTKFDRGDLYVLVEDDQVANGYDGYEDEGVDGEFRIRETPDGYVVSEVPDIVHSSFKDIGTADNAAEVAAIIVDAIREIEKLVNTY